jgi:homoserine kinase
MSRVATVSVPATSANLGPGFDSIGLALDIRDSITACVVESGVTVRINGNGSDVLPTDATHLIAKVILETAEDLGTPIGGLEIECTNAIPQGRGLGSSASAIIAGLVLARPLTDADMTDEELLQRANVFEGHADNISACLLGGVTVAWWDAIDDVKAISLDVHRDVVAVIGIPNLELSTKKARGLLPEQLPYGDAVFNASRTALLIAALTTDPSLLLDATADRLHQEYRRAAYPESMAIVDALRASGIAGAISGAGPTVLALTTAEGVELASQIMRDGGFEPREVAITSTGAQLA